MHEPRKPTIEHPVIGRIVGVLWDIGVTVLTTVAFPWYALQASAELIAVSPAYIPIVVPLMVLAIASFLFGTLWTLRALSLSGGDDDAP